MNHISINGNAYSLYVPKKDYLTPDDHTEIARLHAESGTNVAVDGSHLDHISSRDARNLSKKGDVILNPKPKLAHKIQIYNNTGIPMQTVNDTGGTFDATA